MDQRTDGTDPMKNQPSDEQTVGDVWFYKKTYQFFQDGLKKLLLKLKEYEALEKQFELEASPYREQIDRLQHMIDWGEANLAKAATDSHEVFVRGISYGSLRVLKAAGLVQVHDQERKKAELLGIERPIPAVLVQAIDEKLQQTKNLLEQGAMNGLEIGNLWNELASLEETRVMASLPPPVQKSGRKKSSLGLFAVEPTRGAVTIIDEELRRRCLALLRAVEDKVGNEQLDTVVREMSVVLEDRIRKLGKITSKATGPALMSEAFSGTEPRITFSDEPDLQQSAHLLFMGYAGFVRNAVMHSLVKTYTRERVVQLLGFVDYLLFLLTQAQIRSV